MIPSMRKALWLVLCLSTGWAQDEAALREGAGRAVKALQGVMGRWKQGCNSCHHQMLPLIALAEARKRGIAVDEGAALQAAEGMYAKAWPSIDAVVQYQAISDPALVDGYLLSAASANAIPSSFYTRVAARRLARWQEADGSWKTLDGRPPHSAPGRMTPTALSVRAVRSYAPHETAVVDKARRWLRVQKPQSAEEHAFRLLGLVWSGADESTRAEAAEDALAAALPDGTWGQQAGMPADAYSTGQVVFALQEGAGIRAEQGLAYLLRTQKTEGAWRVATRIHTPAAASPPYFESGLPYGRDQFLSVAATAWAAMALASALPVTLHEAAMTPKASAPTDYETWMEDPADPKKVSKGGSPALFFAAHDKDRVRKLLEAGANPNAKAKGGFDALIVAAQYPGNAEVLRMLLAKGASAKPRNGVLYSANALFYAVNAGDAEMVELLLKNGADPRRKSVLFSLAPFRPLEAAALHEHTEVIRLLHKHGADVDSVDGDGMSSLAWSALNYKPEAMKVLLELGAKRDRVDKFGFTPMDHTRAIEGLPDTCVKLLSR
jgi:hypothetical protein